MYEMQYLQLLLKPKWLPQVFASPRQCSDHWRRIEGSCQALVNIKSAPPAIPFDTPVTGMSQAALGPRKEPAGLLPGSDYRPADVLLPFWANSKDAALDVSVVNPLQQQLAGQVAMEGANGVQHAFNIKMGKYSERCKAEGIVFIPLVHSVPDGTM